MGIRKQEIPLLEFRKMQCRPCQQCCVSTQHASAVGRFELCFLYPLIFLVRKCLLAPPGGVAIRNYWHPLGGVNKNLLAPPPNYFLDDAVLFHCSTAAGSCYPLQIQCMANRRAASGGECRSTSSLPTFLASSRPSLVMAARATLPRPCCRETFLVSTAGDGKSELLQKKQRRARAI